MPRNRSNPRRSTLSQEADNKAPFLCTVLLAIAFGLPSILLVGTTAGPAAAQQPVLSASARQQLQALMDEKASRTPAQRKISSRLLLEMKRRRGDPLVLAVPTLRSSVEIAPDGTTLVDIKADVTADLLSQIEGLGGLIVNSFPQYNAIRARLPLDGLDTLAESPNVGFIRPADQAITNKINTSEGDVAHKADIARATFGVDGTGASVCALSDGVDFLAALQASGDLPAVVTVLPGQGGSGSEGTAMLEIVFDLAPGADLSFATAFGGQASFAQNILDLRAAGCDVIVDDVFYFAEPAFQDGIIAQAVNSVTASGAAYFSAAGNSGNLNDGTSGVWQGDFVDSGTSLPGFPGNPLHDFGGGTPFNTLTANAPFAVTLRWSDPQNGSANDYDLCVLDATFTVIFDCSTNFQTGTQNPFEIIGPSFSGQKLVIINFAGLAAPRFLHLNTLRGRLAIATDGQISGHAAAVDAFAVAAVDVATAGGGQFVGGGTNPVEFFSSDGPRRIFFEADGTPITPGDFLSTGGTVRQKPDIAAADGVSTETPGFNIFFGTSAAASHAAAIAGLMASVNPTLTPADIRKVFGATALDIEAPGVDRDSGFGIVDAFAALAELTGIQVAQTTIDHTWQSVSLPFAFEDPVVIAGPPTFHGRQPGVVRLRNVSGSGFEARFQEWAYLDGRHVDEDVDHLVLERGRHVMPDGSIWEAGTFPLGGTGVWQPESFSEPFAGPPALFLTVQTFNGGQPVTVRARNVTETGFEAALFAEEALMDGHVVEDLGYLAIHSPQGSGSIGVGGSQLPYLLQSPRVNHRFVPVLSSALKLEEEKSQDSERRHVKETVSVLALGDKLFAQDVSGKGGDTVALRRLAPEYAAPMEWGVVDGVTHKWTKVPLAKGYGNPVVVARPVSDRGGHPGVIRLRNVTGDSFDLRYQEWDYLDGNHRTEQVFYLVAEAGVSEVAGLLVEAGKLKTNMLLEGGWETVDLSAPFLDPPAVFTSVDTSKGGDPVTTRVDDVTDVDFLVAMQEEEAKGGFHKTETLGWIAVELGTGTTSDGRDVMVGHTTADDVPAATFFGFTAARRFPVMVADVVSTNGQDPVFLRYQNLTAGDVELFLDEEKSVDAEVSHVLEDVSLFVAE